MNPLPSHIHARTLGVGARHVGTGKRGVNNCRRNGPELCLPFSKSDKINHVSRGHARCGCIHFPLIHPRDIPAASWDKGGDEDAASHGKSEKDALRCRKVPSCVPSSFSIPSHTCDAHPAHILRLLSVLQQSDTRDRLTGGVEKKEEVTGKRKNSIT